MFSDFITDLWASIRAGEVAVFCGAGISFHSGLPLVPDFVGAVLERLATPPADAQAIRASALPFEAFVETVRMDSDISELLRIFGLGEPNPTHVLLAELARAGYVRTLCTTNFDPHIEGALAGVGLVRDRDFDVLFRDEDLARVGDDDRRIRVAKIHGSIDDTALMAITLQQVASRTLSAARQHVIDSMFAGGSHRRVLVLGYSCSDAFDLTPQIEAIEAGHHEVLFVDHHRDAAEIRDLNQKEHKNPFRRFPGSRWILCDTDRLVAELAECAGLTLPQRPAMSSARPRPWERHMDAWAASALAARPGMTAAGIVGEIFYKLSNHEASLRYYSRALEEARAARHRQREGIYLGNVANNEFDLGRTALATAHFEEAIAIARELGDDSRAAMWLGNLAGVHIACAEYGKAREITTQALAICRARGDRSGETACLGNLGHVHYLTGDYSNASCYFEAALAIARQLGDKHAEMGIAGSLGDTANHLGDFASARAWHEEALSAARHLGARSAESNWRGKLANDSVALGDLSRAAAELEEAIALARAIGNRRGEAGRLSDLGNVCYEQRDIERAAALHQESLTIARELGDVAGEGSGLGNLGNTSMAREQFADAIDYYQQAIAIANRLENRQLEATWLANLGAAYYRTDDFPQAIECNQRSLELATAIGNRSGAGNAAFNLGSALEAAGDVERAVRHFRQALEIFTALYGPDHPRTQMAQRSVDEHTMTSTESLYWFQLASADLFALYTASGKHLIPVFTDLDTARRVHALIVTRFPQTLNICQAEGLPRDLFEKAAIESGADANATLFVYEGSESFDRLVGGLESLPPEGA